MSNNFKREAAMLDVPAISVSRGRVVYMNGPARSLFPGVGKGHDVADLGFRIPRDGQSTSYLADGQVYSVRWMKTGRLLYFSDVTPFMRNCYNVSVAMRQALSGMFSEGERLFSALEEMPNPAFHDQLSRMNRSMCRMLKLVDNVRDFTCLSDGDLTLHTSKFDVDEWVETFFRRAQPMLSANGTQVTLSCQDIGRNIFADQRRLETALMNLLSNAVTAAGEKGSVKLEVTSNGRTLAFAVSDNSKDHNRQQLLSVLAQFPDRAAEFDVTGLGLSFGLCRCIAELHGGTFFVSASAEGCRCVITVPFENPDLEARCSEHGFNEYYSKDLVYLSGILPPESYRFM